MGGGVAVPLSQEDNPLAFGHREGALTSPSSPRTVSTSQNAGMLRWPSLSGITWSVPEGRVGLGQGDNPRLLTLSHNEKPTG